MINLAKAQLDFMIRNGFIVQLSYQGPAKSYPFTCKTSGDFGEGSRLGVVTHSHHASSLGWAIDKAYDQIRHAMEEPK